MSLDALVLAYNGRALNSTVLGPLDVSQFQYVHNQLGGVGTANFTVKAAWESQQIRNLTARNMVKAYCRLDETAATVASGATTVSVLYGSRFAVGDEIALYDGVNYNIASITAVSGNTLTIGTATTHAFGVGTTVMMLRYRGMISRVSEDVNLDPTQKVECVSYFTQLGGFTEDSFSGGGKECGWVLYQLLNKNLSKMDVTLDTANFVMSPDGSLTSGTGVPYSSTGNQQTTTTIISDIIKAASQNTAGTEYTLWVDLQGAVHFGPIPTTANVTITLGAFKNQPDGIYDSIGGLTRTYQDTSKLANVVKVTGGSSNSGTVSVIVENSTSISTYGQVESTLSNPHLNDPTDLANWAKWQVENSAYPSEQDVLKLTTTGSFIDCLDVVQINGFTDSSTLTFNPFVVTTAWDVTKKGQFEQQITGGQLHPNVTALMKQIAGQHYTATQNALDSTSNLKDRFVQWGLTLSDDSKNVTLAQGVMAANIVSSGNTEMMEFAIPATTFTPSNGDGAYTVAFLYANADGTEYSTPQAIMYTGTNAANYTGASITNQQVIPLWTYTVLGGQILSPYYDRRNLSGVGQHHLISNPSPNTIPVVTNSPSLTYVNVGEAAYDVKFDMNLNVGQAAWLKCLAFYVVPKGVGPTTRSHIYARIPTASGGQYAGVTLNGLTSGVQWDVWVAFEDQQSQPSAPCYIGTTATNPLNVNPGQLPGVATTTISVADIAFGSPVLGPVTTGVDVTFIPTYTADMLAIKQFVLKAIPTSYTVPTYPGRLKTDIVFGQVNGYGTGVLTNAYIPTSGQSCTVHVSHIPTNATCDLYLYAEGWDGSHISPSPNPIATISAQTLSLTSANLPGMPANTVPQNLSYKNLYPDSEFRTFASNNYGWYSTGGALSLSKGTGPNGSNQLVTPSGTATGNEGIKVSVQANKTYTFAVDVDGSEVTAGTAPSIAIKSADDATVYASVSQALSTNSRLSISYTVPASGVTQVALHFIGGGGTVAAGNSAKFSQPQFEIGSTETSYVPSFAQAYPVVGGATYEAQAYIELDVTSSTDWLDTIELMAQPNDGLSDWSYYSSVVPDAGGEYACTWGGLGAGTSYLLGIRYKDKRGAYSSVLSVATTTANPIQSTAIAQGAVGITQTTGIFDGNGKLLYSNAPPQVQQAVNNDGTVNASLLAGDNAIPYGVNSGQVQAAILSSPQTGTSSQLNVANNQISTNQIQNVSVVNTQLAPERYDTSLHNSQGGGSSYQWYSKNTSAFLAAAATLTNGDTLIYNCGTAMDTSSANAQADTYTIPANGSVILEFLHNAFTTGGQGDIKIAFTGNSVSTAPAVANSPSISGSDQPSITHTTTNNYTNDLQQHSFTTQTSTATISQQANAQTYTMNQHNSGDKASGTMAATITQSTGISGPTTTTLGTFGFNVGTQTSTDYTSPNAGCAETTYSYSRVANANLPWGNTGHAANNMYSDGSHPLTFNYNFPSSVSFTSGTNGSREKSTYNSKTQEYIYTCTPSADNRTYPSFALTWNVRLTTPDNQTFNWTGVTGQSSITFNGTGVAGVYTWEIQPQWTSDPGGTATSDGSVSVSTTVSETYYQQSTTYVSNNTSWQTLYTTPSGIVAPQTAGTQLTWQSTGVTNASDTHGAAAVYARIVRSSDGTVVWGPTAVAASTAYNYYSGTENGTQFHIDVCAEITTNNNNGASTYNCSTDGTLDWYNNDANPITYSYITANGSTITETTDNNSNIVAPTASGVAVGVNIQSLSMTSNAQGASGLFMDIVDPNGTKVVSAQPITATGTYSYYNSSAVKGQYTFNFYAEITTNNNDASGTQNYPVSFSGYIFDYNNVNHPITTYYNNAGTLAQYSTASNTVAPNTSGQQLSLNLSSVTAQGTNSSYGTNDICIQLQDPAGNYLAFQYSTDNGVTWNTAAANTAWAPNGHPVANVSGPVQCAYSNATQNQTGTYSWTVYGMVNSNDTGDAQYTNSWSGTQTYYTPGASGGNTYVLAADGTTQRLATNDNDINFTLLRSDTLRFNVYNNAAQAVSFSIAADCRGV